MKVVLRISALLLIIWRSMNPVSLDETTQNILHYFGRKQECQIVWILLFGKNYQNVEQISSLLGEVSKRTIKDESLACLKFNEMGIYLIKLFTAVVIPYLNKLECLLPSFTSTTIFCSLGRRYGPLFSLFLWSLWALQDLNQCFIGCLPEWNP